MTTNTVRLVIEAVDKSKAAFQSSEKSLNGLMTTVGKASLALAAFGVVATQAFEFGREGAQIARLEASGRSLAASYGGSMDKMLAAMKRAALGTVAETDLILSANRAMMLGVSTDADQMANLLEVAALRGRAMGLSTTQAFNDIVTGIGRMSPLILDNLGIVTNLNARVEEWAKANGVAADSVDDATKRQILLNAVLEDGNKQLAETGGLVDDAASSYERFGAAASDAWSRLMKIAGVAGGSIVGSAADALVELNKTNAALDALGARRLRYGLAELPTGEFVHFTELLQRMNHVVLTSKDSYDAFDKSVRAAGGSFSGWSADMQRWIALAESFEAPEVDFPAPTSQDVQNWQDLLGVASSGSIQRMIDDLEFGMAGGFETAADIQFVNDLLENNKITPQQAKDMFSGIYVELQGIEQNLGNITASEAAENIKSTLGMSLSEAKDFADGIRSSLDGMQGLITNSEAIVKLTVEGDTWIAELLSNKVVGSFVGGTRNPGIYGGGKPDPTQRASGGPIDPTMGLVEVGEQGAEGMYWDPRQKKWVVVPHGEWTAMKKRGFAPSTGMATGGTLNSGIGPSAEGIQFSKGSGFVTTQGDLYPSNIATSIGRSRGPAIRQTIGGGDAYFVTPSGAFPSPWNNQGSNNGSAAQQVASIASQAATAAASGVAAASIQSSQTQATQATTQAIAASAASFARVGQDIAKEIRALRKQIRDDFKLAVQDALAGVA